MRLQRRGVGHAEAGAIDVKGPVAVPAPGGVEGRTQGGADAAQEGLEDMQRQAGAGVAVGGVAEDLVRELPESSHGDIALEDLEQEEMDGGNRVEHALPEVVTHLATDLEDGLRLEKLGELGLDLLES